MTTKPACLRFVAAAIALIATVASSIAQTLIWPVDAPRVTQDYASYGGVIASKFHTGIDITSAISAANNTQVLAAGAGTVIMANNTCTAGNTTCGGGWGNYVVIRHNSGLFTLYAHMFSVSVSVGASVVQGQVIGIMGATGNVTGAHIHFDILTSQPSTTSDFGPGYTTDHPANLGHPDPRDYIQRFPVTVNTTTLSVRKKPSASETLVTTVSQGQQFIALAQSANGWYFIFLPSSVIPSTSTLDDDRYGWVSGSFLIVNPSPSPAQVKISGTLLWSGGATSLRVRSGAGTGFSELTKVLGGQSFVTFGTPTSGTGSTLPWYKIHLPANAGATEGWVAGDYLSVSGTTTPTRIISLSGNLDFGVVEVGSSAQRTLTIANTGNSTLTVSSISYPSGFSGSWSGTIAAGNSQNVTVTFSPNGGIGPYAGTVTVNSDKTSGGNTIFASGTGGLTPTRIISLSGNLAFGNVTVGASAQSTLNIANTGNSTLTVSSISYPSGFSGSWSGTIAAGSSQNVTVTFSPSAATSYGGTVTVNSDKTSGVNTIAASGTGTAAPTRIISLSGNLAFGNVTVGSSAQSTLTIANNGNSTMTVSSISYPSGFSGNWSSGTIAAGGSQNVTVTFSPSAAISYGGTVTVNANQTSGGNTIAAAGTGTITPTRIISLSGDLAFGSVVVGSSAQRTLTIANNGNSTLTVSSISYPSGFSGNWSSGTIPAGGSQNVTVTFSPSSAISYGGTVTVNSDKTSGANTIAASGTGTPVSDGFVFFDDMENGQGAWGMQTPWGLTTASSHSASHAWTDSPGGNYPNNTNVSLNSPLIDLTGKSAATLTFWHRFDFAAGDAGYIWVLPQGGSFTTALRSFSGTDLSWHQESVDLSNYVGQVVTVYFQLLSDASGVADGWYVDDVAVTASVQKQLTAMSLSNGVFRFVLNGSVGSNYVIQVSSNLVNWLPLSTNIVPAGGSVTITDSSMSTLPRRFYRAIPQTAGATPSNDLFADRIVITGNNATVSGSNIAATMESGEPFHWSSTGGKSVWWSWQAPSSGVVTISTAGSSFDTVLAAYTGNSVGGLTLVQNNDDFGGNLTSQVSFAATSGTVYQIAVDGFGGASGTTSLSLSQP